MSLLARWREPRAYSYVVRWLSLPGEAPFEIAGDVVTQDGARMLAAVCDGDLEPIKALVVDRSANEYGRDVFWHDFKFVNPVTKKMEPKSMYCERADDLVVCGGIYKAV